MGLPQRELYLTKIDDDNNGVNKMALLSAWIPNKHDDGKYYHPKDVPIGLDMFVPNVLNITYQDGPIPVKIVKSDKITGLWLACYNDYFGNEMHLFNYKPQFDESHQKIDYDYEDKLNENSDYTLWEIHVYVQNIKMKAGDEPIPVTLEYGHAEYNFN